jgi:ParB family chromosome partitioning protein
VAENQKRHGLTPLDLARFIRQQVDAGESNATIAKRVDMNLTTVAHHLALLDPPPALDHALKSGRYTSPRTLHELSKLHEERPEQVRALVAGDAQITRTTVAAVRASPTSPTPATSKSSQTTTPLARAHAACDRFEHALEQIKLPAHGAASADLIALRQRIVDVATRWLQGV